MVQYRATFPLSPRLPNKNSKIVVASCYGLRYGSPVTNGETMDEIRLPAPYGLWITAKTHSTTDQIDWEELYNASGYKIGTLAEIAKIDEGSPRSTKDR